MGATLVILDPLGEVAVTDHPLAPRLRDLRGKTLGIIDNGMPGSNDILSTLADMMRETEGIKEVIVRIKPNVSRPAPPEIVNELVARCDFVICGVGV
ncbi:MAG: hypothetical protein AAB289_04855 [Chloroflexota bacterium]